MVEVSAQRRVILVMGSRYVNRVHHGVAQYAGQRHWHLTNLFGDDPNLIRGRECDGIIAALGECDALSDAVVQRREPKVSLSIAREHLRMTHITGDNEAMGRAAARYFLDRGFRRFIWYSETTEASAVRRLSGYREALQEAGSDCVALIRGKIFPEGPPRWHQQSIWIQNAVRQVGSPCAVYAFNDSQAVNLLDACLAGGIRVPGEVAILGTDNHPLICPTAAVPLSSVNHDLDELGRRAAQELDYLMDGAKRTRKVIEIPHLGITTRQSSDIFAINDPEVVRALRYLYENYNRQIGVESIVRATTLSRRSLERRFQAHLKLSILGKLRDLRMDEASRLLRETDLPIAEIASRCGYTTPEYLHRCFKQSTGMTPRSYRASFITEYRLHRLE